MKSEKYCYLLQSILADPTILKVGVASMDDASKLNKDFGISVQGVFDVRRLIPEHPLHERLRIKPGLEGEITTLDIKGKEEES